MLKDLLEVQHARTARARALLAESDAALARADEASHNLTILRRLETTGPAHPQTRANILAEWEHWTVTARRLHTAALDAVLGR